MFSKLLLLLPFILQVAASPLSDDSRVAKRCTGTIQSLTDIDAAVKCLTIVIGGFTVPAGQTFTLPAPNGATVSLTGTLTFAYKEWEGPLMVITGKNVTFNGGGHALDGLGAQYWDGLGGNGGVTKPAPLLRINMGGTFTNLKVLNTPARSVAIGGDNLVVSNITVDNSAGDAANSKSAGKSAGHNTDGFDISAHSVTVQNSVIMNQDDCLALNKGTDIKFLNNKCSGGHGISIGSISSNTVVSGVTISGNTVTNSDNGLRIKTKVDAISSSVSDVTFSGNTLSSIHKFGVIIDQSYPTTLGTPGNGVAMSGVAFTGTNTIAVESTADRLDINCGVGSCTGTWNLAGLTITGGKAGKIVNANTTGGTY